LPRSPPISAKYVQNSLFDLNRPRSSLTTGKITALSQRLASRRPDFPAFAAKLAR
jgi:hypothetical protein